MSDTLVREAPLKKSPYLFGHVLTIYYGGDDGTERNILAIANYSVPPSSGATMSSSGLPLGIAQIAIAPPPLTQPGTLGHFIFGPI